MAPTVRIDAATVEISFSGIDKLLSFATHETIALSSITSVRIVGWNEVRASLGWRTLGGYWPGWFATGWYSVPGEKGDRQLLCVYRKRDQLLCIDSAGPRLRRVVLQHPDAAVLAEQIWARVTTG